MQDSQIYKARLKIGELEFEVEGDKEFVQQEMLAWKTEGVRNFESFITSGSKVQERTTKSITQAKEVTLEGLDLPEFYQKHSAITHPERIAIFAYFLEKSADKELFTAQDILEAYDEVRIQPPKNIHDILSKIYKRNGYILPKGKGNWKLAKKGIDFVESNIKSTEQEVDDHI